MTFVNERIDGKHQTIDGEKNVVLIYKGNRENYLHAWKDQQDRFI